MKKYLEKLPAELKELIRLAAGLSEKNKIPAYLVGGFVRDLLLGVKNLDLDVVVEGSGIKFAEALSTALHAKLTCHCRFGTATLTLRPNLKIDIATTRQEAYPKPASLPVVTFSTLRDDLARRDFSINAMAISITGNNFGEIVDYFHGKDDLRNKKIRVLHDLSFIDDPTRILRGIRFEKRYDFDIEPKTLRYLKDAVKMKMLEQTQPQRVRDELVLAFKEKRPLKQLRRIKELAGLGFINKHLTLVGSTHKLLNSIDRETAWFNKNYPQRRPLDNWLIYFMGLLDPLTLNDAENVCRKFVFRKGEEKRIINFKKVERKAISQLKKSKIKPSRIFSLLEPLSYEVIVLLKAKYKNNNIQKHIKDFFEIYNGMRIIISGDDLHRLGIAPGPYYQNIFTKVLKAKLEGIVKTKEEELSLIKEII